MIGDGSRHAEALGDSYRIDRELGHGGMATVYLAEDLKHRRRVAVKVLRQDLAQQLGPQRFLHEIAIVAKLSHPHILPVFDSGERAGILFYVMPFVEGGSLRDRLSRDGAPELRDTVRMLRDVADALAYAHSRGVVHRDLKPDNVMLSGRHALVTDFGVARALTESTGEHHITTAGVALGTPTYMAPEQAAADPNIDHRADIYAFGVLAYELLTGRPPFSGPASAVMAAHVTRNPEPVLTHRPGLPRALAAMVMRCLAKAPDQRWQTLDEVGADLEAAMTPSGGVPRTGAQQPAPPAATPGQPSIAVLPFKNVSADRENEYFADGMTEEIINALSQIPALNIAARTSCFAFKGQDQDVRTIGERLGVTSVLEGSIRQAGRRVRITVQLIKVADGYQLWSQRYDRDLEDIFAIQDEIASSIVSALTTRLVAPDDVRVKRADVKAYDLYLKGRFQWNKRTNVAMQEAIALFSQALAIDPDYAPAYAGIADCYGLLGWIAFGAMPPNEAYPKSEEAARKALALDPDLAEAHNTLGWSRLVFAWNWAESERHYQRALELNPRYAMGHSWYGLALTWVGRPDEGFAQADVAMTQDPLSLIIRTLAAWAYYFAGRYDDAIALYRRTLEMDRENARAHLGLGWAYEQVGDLEAAIGHFSRAAALSGQSPRHVSALAHAQALAGRKDEAHRLLRHLDSVASAVFVSPAYRASVYSGLRDADRAFEWLERAFEERSGGLAYLHVDPQFAWLRDDPRFGALVSRVGIAAPETNEK